MNIVLGMLQFLAIALVTTVAWAGDYYVSTTESYQKLFEDEILPLMAESDTGYFEGTAGAKLFYSNFIHQDPKGSIVVVHGFSESLPKYRETIFDFYKNGFNVYFFEQRGHGLSDRFGKHYESIHVRDYRYYLEDLRIFMDRFVDSSGSVHLFGHSMGGGVVVRYAQLYPRKVTSAVLSAPMMGLVTGKYPRWLARILAQGGSALGKAEDYAPGKGGFKPDDWVFNGDRLTSSRVRFEKFAGDLLADDTYPPTGGATYGWVNEAMKLNRIVKNKRLLGEMKTPILLFQAELETIVTFGEQEAFCDKVDSCKLVVLEGSKHDIYLERDEIRLGFMKSVLRFFDGFS